MLPDADESDAGIASEVNNAIARVAGLLGIAAVGAVITAQFNSTLNHSLAGVRLSPAARAAVSQARRQTLAHVDPSRLGLEVSHAVQSASVHAFHASIGLSAALVALGGLLGLAAIRNPRRVIHAEDCAGGPARRPAGRRRAPTRATTPSSADPHLDRTRPSPVT